MNLTPKVAIIIINYNHNKETLNCIESILNSTYNNIILYVIDNGSEIKDYNLLCSSIYDRRIILIRQNTNVGYAKGVNIGFKESSKNNPDYYLIMNNDTIIDKNAINELVLAAKKHNNCAIVTGKVFNMEEPDTLQYIGQKCKNKNKLQYPPYIKNTKEKDIGQFDFEIELGMADDIFWIIPNKIYKNVGNYSPDFFLYGEQNDYALRVIKQGYKLIFTPKAKIWHHHHLTTGSCEEGLKKIKFWNSYAELLLAYKHLSSFWFINFYIKMAFKVSSKYLLSVIMGYDFRIRQKAKLEALIKFTKNIIYKSISLISIY